MDIPDELFYSNEHLWVRIEDDKAFVGITDYAQSELKAIEGVELPEEGDIIEKDKGFGYLESKKIVQEVISPLSGKVIEVNMALLEKPELVNEDPYGDGWLARIELTHPNEVEALMSADEYDGFIDQIIADIEAMEDDDLDDEDEF